jgi:ribokinase
VQASARRFAVVGHVEWVQFAYVEHLPRAGEVAHARDAFEEPAGGGAVAAVQLARLAGSSMLLTALGDDEPARRSLARLRELGVDVHAVTRAEPTRRALTLLDRDGEHTITTLGPRLEPHRADDLPWEELADMDGVYFTAGDRGALAAARCARALVASPRAREALGGRPLDAIVLSADDAIERAALEGIEQDANLIAFTEGERGGSYRLRSGESGRWAALEPPPPLEPEPTADPRRGPGGRESPPTDSYGCGDSFAAGLTFALAEGLPLQESLVLGARCGAACATGRGPYERMLRR